MVTQLNQGTKLDKNEKFWKFFYGIMCLLGLISILFEIDIYRKTLIKTSLLFYIIILVGLLFFFFDRNHYKRIYKLRNSFFPLLQNIISWGFLSCYFFIATNYYLADKSQNEYKFKIVNKGSMPGSKYHRSERNPLVIFDYFGFKKELVFGYSATQKVNTADSVKISIRKGRLGYNILEQYDVF